MVTISFQAEKDDASKLIAMLKAHGVQNLIKKDTVDISPEQAESIKLGLNQANAGLVKESSTVHAKARELCSK